MSRVWDRHRISRSFQVVTGVMGCCLVSSAVLQAITVDSYHLAHTLYSEITARVPPSLPSGSL